MKTTFEKELYKIFGDDILLEDTKYIGRACYGSIGADIKVKAEFNTLGYADHYQSLKISLLNRTDGIIDTINIRFGELWGKKHIPNNPNFEDGLSPHLWVYNGTLEWYAYNPTPRDVEKLQNSIKDYTDVFREKPFEKEIKPSIRKQLAENKAKAADVPKPKGRKKAQDLEV